MYNEYIDNIMHNYIEFGKVKVCRIIFNGAFINNDNLLPRLLYNCLALQTVHDVHVRS